MNKLIRVSVLNRMLGFHVGKVNKHLAKQKEIGVVRWGGNLYLSLEQAKIIACELIIHTNRKLEDVLEEINNYEP